jgi:hypothetical protein
LWLALCFVAGRGHEYLQTATCGGAPAFRGYIEPRLAVWTSWLAFSSSWSTRSGSQPRAHNSPSSELRRWSRFHGRPKYALLVLGTWSLSLHRSSQELSVKLSQPK